MRERAFATAVAQAGRAAILMGSALILAACATASSPPAAAAPQQSPTSVAASPTASPVPTATPVAAPPSSATYPISPVAGASLSGSVQVDRSSADPRVTVTVSGLDPRGVYLVDADPLPCLFFVGGPSQSFAQQLRPDSAGKATATWSVPNGMLSNVNVQVLRDGKFAVVSCVDIR